MLQNPADGRPIYNRLKPGNIRLLEFLDESGLHCSIREFGIHDAPRYACLSYTWKDGEVDDNETSSITLQSHIHKIKKNLGDALRYLAPATYRRELRLWVDAICINQDDLQERAEQVKLMKVLYEQAEEVLAWIGLPHDEKDIAQGVEFMRALINCADDFYAVNRDETTLESWLAALKRRVPLQPNDDTNILAAWAAVVQMLRRPYWTRTWVHQEATVPHARFYCGHFSFGWAELMAFSTFHTSYGGVRDFPNNLLLMFRGSTNVGTPLFDMINAHVNRCQVLEEGRINMARLSPLVRDLRLTSCADARDKVFAALPHAVDIDSVSACDLLATDYLKPVIDIYTDLARYSILNGRGLEILGFVCSLQGSQDVYRPARDHGERPVPTWVPDWRIANRIRPLNSIGLLHGDYSILYKPLPASTTSHPVCIGLELHVRAVIFDTLVAITSSVGRDIDLPAVRHDWRAELMQGCPDFSDDAFNRTVVADSQHIQDRNAVRGSNARFGSIDWALFDLPPSQRGPQDEIRRQNMFHALRGVTRDRRGGCIQSGRLGIFPESAKPGDGVAAFHRGDALYVVRKIPEYVDKYQFVGECYVDQMMDGQIVDFAAKRGISTSTIVLI